METVKSYIESGILELYVLDQLNDLERKEIEIIANKHPEIKQEIEAIEIALEQYALLNAKEPSEDLKNKILNKIEIPYSPSVNEFVAKDNVVLLNSSGFQSKIKVLRIALGACASLLLLTLFTLYNTHSRLGKANDQIAFLNAEKQQFANVMETSQKENTDLKLIANMPNDPDWKTIKLKGTPMDPSAKMLVYWHTSGKHVLLDNSNMKLPVNDQTHQYQLWAIVEGKPVDLGVFDAHTSDSKILLTMKQIADATTFAVTLEKRGGSESPTMSKMIVAGNIS